MNSYIYDKMPARIVGCSQPTAIQCNNDSTNYTITLNLWEEEYDYLVITLYPTDIYLDNTTTSVTDIPINGMIPLSYIVPKNAIDYQLLLFERIFSDDRQAKSIDYDQNHTITITNNQIELHLAENNRTITTLITFTAYKNNI